MHPSTNRLWRKVSQLIILYVVLKSCYSMDFSWILQNILKEWKNHKTKNFKPLPDPYPHVQSNHWWHCDTLLCPIPQTIAPHRNILLSNFQSTPKYVVKWARHRSVELIASSAALVPLPLGDNGQLLHFCYAASITLPRFQQMFSAGWGRLSFVLLTPIPLNLYSVIEKMYTSVVSRYTQALGIGDVWCFYQNQVYIHFNFIQWLLQGKQKRSTSQEWRWHEFLQKENNYLVVLDN